MNKQIKYKKVVEWNNLQTFKDPIIIMMYSWFGYSFGLGNDWRFLIFFSLLWAILALNGLPKRKVYWVRDK